MTSLKNRVFKALGKGKIPPVQEIQRDIALAYEGKLDSSEAEQRVNDYARGYLASGTDKAANVLSNLKETYQKVNGSIPDETTLKEMAADYAVYRKLFNIKVTPYIKSKMFNMSFEDRLAAITEGGKIRRKSDREGIAQMAEALGKSKLEIIREYSDRISELEVTFAQFSKYQMYLMPASGQEIKARGLNKKYERKEEKITVLSESLGLSGKEVRQRIKTLKERTGYNVNITMFYNLELDKKSEEEIEIALKQADAAQKQGDRVKVLLDDVRLGKLAFSEVKEELDRLYALCEVFATDRKAEELRELYDEDILAALTPEELKRRTLDCDVTKKTLGFDAKEYVAFKFGEHDFEPRLKYISDIDSKKMLLHMVTTEARDILNDKYKSYEAFKQWYGRKIVQIQDAGDYETFREFFDTHECFVKKSVTGSLGETVKLVKTEDENAEELFEQYVSETGGVILEELVKSHPAVARFNPDSVNTVRLVTYRDGDNVYFPCVTMRVGMKGSFVDNAGSGGISVRIDQATGQIVTDGFRQNGTSFAVHPDTGVAFKGAELPNWDKALQVGREVARALTGAVYVGWDLALNDKGEWIVIEGNPMPQLFGIQSTTGVGAWENFHGMFLKQKGDNIYEKIYMMPYSHNVPGKRDPVLAALSKETGIAYEEVYYKAMRAFAYFDIPPEVYAEKKLILKDETELEKERL